MVRKENLQVNYTINIKRIGDHKLPLPARAKPGDAGYDLMTTIDWTLYPGERKLFPTGFAWEITPVGQSIFGATHYGLIRDRSGIASKRGVIVAAGIVDGNYRGEVFVLLINTSNDTVEISKGERIAQLIISTALLPELIEVSQLDDTIRGENGFGSTGS
jgi:dUTP pyrophosphatase